MITKNIDEKVHKDIAISRMLMMANYEEMDRVSKLLGDMYNAIKHTERIKRGMILQECFGKQELEEFENEVRTYYKKRYGNKDKVDFINIVSADILSKMK